MTQQGEDMLALAKELFPICRSLSGEGVRQTLRILRREMPEMVVHEVPSGTRCFDWTTPKEWNIRDAYILDPDGRKIVDFQQSNLHVVGYSLPVDRELSLEDLQAHLHSMPEQPDVIPYVTSYYAERWGFCISDRQRRALAPGRYRVFIDADLSPGVLNYGEVLLPGASEKEIFLSTYVCHPSMANNELSGPVVTTALINWVRRNSDRRYSYRAVFIPETIGSIAYLSRHLDLLKERVVAGFVVTCVGDDRAYSYVPSRLGGTLADRVALHTLGHLAPHFQSFTYLDRGSDERQYCSPGVDLPVVSVMRSKYGTYPEYHTSADDFSLVTASGLAGAFSVIQRCIECIEGNRKLEVTVCGEPQLGARGLYPTLSTRESVQQDVKTMMDLIAYCDGDHSLLDVAERLGVPMWELFDIAGKLCDAGLLKTVAAGA